jgi:hypothetical protein
LHCIWLGCTCTLIHFSQTLTLSKYYMTHMYTHSSFRHSVVVVNSQNRCVGLEGSCRSDSSHRWRSRARQHRDELTVCLVSRLAAPTPHSLRQPFAPLLHLSDRLETSHWRPTTTTGGGDSLSPSLSPSPSNPEGRFAHAPNRNRPDLPAPPWVKPRQHVRRRPLICGTLPSRCRTMTPSPQHRHRHHYPDHLCDHDQDRWSTAAVNRRVRLRLLVEGTTRLRWSRITSRSLW